MNIRWKCHSHNFCRCVCIADNGLFVKCMYVSLTKGAYKIATEMCWGHVAMCIFNMHQRIGGCLFRLFIRRFACKISWNMKAFVSGDFLFCLNKLKLRQRQKKNNFLHLTSCLRKIAGNAAYDMRIAFLYSIAYFACCQPPPLPMPVSQR